MIEKEILGFMIDPEDVGNYRKAFEVSQEKLASLSVEEILQNTGANYLPESQAFSFESFSRNIAITYPEGRVFFRDHQDLNPVLSWRLPLLNYLTCGQLIDPETGWKSYRELPNGNTFYPAILTNCLTPLAYSFGSSDPTLWQEALHMLGFKTELKNGKVEAQGSFAPKVPVLIKFWPGDEEVQPACQILFKSSISAILHIEDIAALCGLIRYLIEETVNHLSK